MQIAPHTPSDAARDLVRGAYDLHVHVAPDLIPRRIDDVSLARRFREVGLGGFALKSHFAPTAERAAVVANVAPETHVLGAIVLNSGVGGMNPVALEFAARQGARIAWMPTFDALNEITRHLSEDVDAMPIWARLQHELRQDGVDTRAVRVVDTDGRILPETRAVLSRIAHHGMVLATGHLHRDEIFAVVDAALEQHVSNIIITHPEYPSQSLSIEDQRSLARRGAFLERCFTTAHGGRVSWELMLDHIRRTSVKQTFLSSDLGQRENPPVEDGLALFADRLLAGGFSEEQIHTMTVENTRRLALPPD